MYSHPAQPESGHSSPLPPPITQSPEILASIFEFAPDANLLADADGRILLVNKLAEQMFGYTRDELVGELVEILIPERFIPRYVENRLGYMDAPRSRPTEAGVDLFAKRKDGTEFPVDVLLSTLETENGVVTLAVVRDITERKQAEADALRASEMYRKELHHRVKNNLQVISSLLFLQSTYTNDPNTLSILKDSQSRVKSIALILEKLYCSPQLTKIHVSEYIRDLVSDLFRTYGISHKTIVVDTQIADVSLEIDTAIPCGLIINELVSNVFKHAFSDGRNGKVTIELLSAAAKEFVLIVQDDGIGLPKDYDWRASPTLGLQLVNDLARQLNGKIQMDANRGTTFRITFKEVEYKERS